LAEDKPCCPDCAEKEARSAVMARYQDGGPVLPDLDRERRANFFKRTKKAMPSFQNGGQVSVQESLEAAQRRLDEERLQQRLAEASPLERNVYETLGLEPGLDRGVFLPVAYGPGDERELATPALIYDFLKAMSAPGAALRGVPVSDQEVVETAFETMGGGTAFGPAVDGFALGMAMSPKGRIMRPKESIDLDPDVRDLAEDPTNMAQYYAMLKGNLEENLADTDLGVVGDVLKKAEKYFSGEFGTADDRLRQRMIAGDIAPSGPEDAMSKGRLEDALEYLRFTSDPSREQALRNFEEAYDRSTNITRTVYENEDYMPLTTGGNIRTSPSTPSSLRDPIAQYQRMVDQGVDPEKITGVRYTTSTSPEFDLEEALEIDRFRSSVPLRPMELAFMEPTIDASVQPIPGYSSRGLNPILRASGEPSDFPGRAAYERAIQEGEVIYDIEPDYFAIGGLDFLSPALLAEGISKLPKNKIKSLSFPDLVVESASKMLRSPIQIEQRRVAQEVSSEAQRRMGQEGIGGLFGPVERGNMISKELKIGPESGAEKFIETGIGENQNAWYRLTTPESLEIESALMSNSIKGYGDQADYSAFGGGTREFKRGETQVFSLRDSNGNSIITTDVKMNAPGGPKVIDAQPYANDGMVPAEYLDDLFALYDELGVDGTQPSMDGYVEGVRNFDTKYSEYIERSSTPDALLPEIEALRQRSAQRTGRTRGEAIENNPNIFGVNQRNNPYDPENN